MLNNPYRRLQQAYFSEHSTPTEVQLALAHFEQENPFVDGEMQIEFDMASKQNTQPFYCPPDCLCHWVSQNRHLMFRSNTLASEPGTSSSDSDQSMPDDGDMKKGQNQRMVEERLWAMAQITHFTPKLSEDV